MPVKLQKNKNRAKFKLTNKLKRYIPEYNTNYSKISNYW